MRFILLCILLLNGYTFAQVKIFNERRSTLVLRQALATNGLHSKNYLNNASFNLISGYSGALLGLEISGISSFHSHTSFGVQLSGLTNIVGGNRRDLKEYSESELNNLASDYSGLQISGIANIVTGSVMGFQIGGIMNASQYGLLSRIQLSGFVNYIDDFVEGVQISSLINVSRKYVTGLSGNCRPQ